MHQATAYTLLSVHDGALFWLPMVSSDSLICMDSDRNPLPSTIVDTPSPITIISKQGDPTIVPEKTSPIFKAYHKLYAPNNEAF